MLQYNSQIVDKITGGPDSKKTKRTAFIKSVFRPSAQERHKITLKNGEIAKINRAPDAAFHFAFSRSLSKGLLNTGFWERIDNPYKAKSFEESGLSSDWKDSEIWLRNQITIQEYLEIKYNQKPGFLTSELADLWGQRKSTKPTYIQAFRYPLKDGVTILDLDKMEDEIMYIGALRTSKIANSAREANPVKHSHYISQVNESEVEQAKKTEVYEEAVARLYKIKNEFDSETVKQFAVVLDIVKKDDVSVRSLKNKLSDYINDKQYGRENIQTFFKYYDLFTGNKTEKARFEATYVLKTLVNNHIISVNKGTYSWGNAPEQSVQKLGLSEAAVVEFLLDKDKSEWRKMLCEELKSKTGIILK